MKSMVLSLILIAIAAILTGCTDTETLVGAASGDPKLLLKAYAGIFCSLFVNNPAALLWQRPQGV